MLEISFRSIHKNVTNILKFLLHYTVLSLSSGTVLTGGIEETERETVSVYSTFSFNFQAVLLEHRTILVFTITLF